MGMGAIAEAIEALMLSKEKAARGEIWTEEDHEQLAELIEKLLEKVYTQRVHITPRLPSPQPWSAC